MLELLLDNIFVTFGGTIFQQCIGIPICTNCVPLPADLFLYSYQSAFRQNVVKDKKVKEARSFYCIYQYFDNVFSIRNSKFVYLSTRKRILNEYENSFICVIFFYLHLEFDDSCHLSTKCITNETNLMLKFKIFLSFAAISFLCISQLLRYVRASSDYSDSSRRDRCIETGL